MKEEKEEECTVPELEFDGTTVLCRVCGDKASGFHYGVHSCEGCKGFFRRSIQQKIQYRPCTKNQQCSILRINRNRCQYCRLKKCIAVGMSRDAVRFGRVPKREKAKILAEMQRVNARSKENALTTELEDDNKLIATIIQAHAETCEYTRDKVTPLLENARQNPIFMLCPPQLACPLNPNPQPLHNKTRILEDFSERFSPAIRGVVEFAKRIPGFNLLPQENQVTLLKAGVFEVLLVRLACMFDSATDTMLCLNGQAIKRENLHSASNARFLMDSMFDFAERFNSLNLNDNAIGVFCAAVVIAPDRPGLRNVEFIERMHSKLMQALQRIVISSHLDNPSVFAELVKKIPDLRTLNTLHSEKLLAFKMEPSEMNGKMCSTTTTTLDDLHDYSNLYQIPAQPTEGYHSLWVEEWKHLQECNNGSPGQQSSTSSEWNGHSKTTNHLNSDTDSPQSLELTSTSSGDMCDRKSPMSPLSKGQISSDSESICSGEIAQLTDLKISKCKDISNSGSCSENEDHYTGQIKRKLEINSDSGVESGKELSSSRPPSFELAHSLLEKCNTSDSDNSDISKPEAPEKDMPVLKRALQAPPLVRTLNIYGDDAYKPHKKFRAFRRDSSEKSENGDTSTGILRAMRNVEGPRFGESHLKRNDIINNIIMKSENINTRPTEVVMQRETTGCLFPTSAPMTQINQQNFMNGNMMPKGQMVCAPYYIPQPIMTNNIAYPATTTWTLVPANMNGMTARLSMHASPQVVNGTHTPVSFAPRPLMPPVSPGLQSPPPTRMYYDPRTPSSVMMMCPNNFSMQQAHGKVLQVPNSPSAPQSMETPDEVGEPLNLSKRIQLMSEGISESSLTGVHIKVEPV